MRDTFVRALLEHARRQRDILLVTGDLGFGVLDHFRSELPAQFINAGVAEQNMTGLAAGMALEGKQVYTYSIGNFPTLRALEQIRNDVLYHDACVNVVAVGGGFSYGPLGMSHHATEDIGILRPLPGLRIIAPCDEVETIAAADLMVSSPAPTYLRIDKSKVVRPEVPAGPFDLKRLRRLRAGRDLAMLAYGGIVGEVLAAADALAARGVEASVFSVPMLKPFDEVGLLDVVATHPALLVVEEHVGTGGLGSVVADLLFEHGRAPVRAARMALPDRFSSIVGSQEYLRLRHGLDAESITARAQQLLGGDR